MANGFTDRVPDKRKYSHYFKDCPFDQIDVYRVIVLFNVTDPCIQHALKKLLVAGGRGAGKDIDKDILEAIDSLNRFQDMRAEEQESYSIKASAMSPLPMPSAPMPQRSVCIVCHRPHQSCTCPAFS